MEPVFVIAKPYAARIATTLVAMLALSAAPAAFANHPQPSPDIAKMDYTPIGFYKPGDPLPSPLAPPSDSNPSGKFVAYDTNVFESLNLPSRHPGDDSPNDAPGSGDPRYGFCPPSDPTFLPWGKCANHQLEYLDYFERTMRQILGDFGVTTKRYEFTSPGTGGRGGFLDGAGGRAFNVAAVVPGADHPDETVLISGHYDVTDSGPAPAWDSSEGHAEVIRVAKIMADYWRATGTRPSATVKFIPWDSEESGTFGSIDYVENNIPPGEESKVRAYFNLDPAAGAYPAFRSGNPASRVPEVLQLADPEGQDDPAAKARIQSFNARAETIVDEVLDNLDDRLSSAPGQPEIFVSDSEASAGGPSSQRDEIVTALGGLAAFSSDYANFEAVGVPIFNPFPDYFGPHADGTPASAEGVGILHTPRDNLTTLNALTSSDQSGTTASEGWAKGMEFAAQLESWYMLQPEMGGAQTASPEVVAYYEALPNEAIKDQRVRFDASGSYQYTQVATRQLADESALTYSWDFGDGQTGTGRVAEHAYSAVGRYTTTLTVRNAVTGATDTMGLPVEVVPANLRGPQLKALPADDADGRFTLEWTFDGARDGFDRFVVEQSSNLSTPLQDGAEGDIGRLWTRSTPADPRVQPWQSSKGSPALNGNKRHSGESSYWTGAVPAAPSPTDVESVLTLKQPVSVPKKGDPELSYWSLFQSEGDDEGRVDVALDDGDPGTEPDWQAVDGTGGFFAPGVEGNPVTEELTNRRVDLGRFKGKRVLIRFRYILGPEDRAASQPAGWYIDDVRLESGTWSAIGSTAGSSFPVTVKRPGTYGYRVDGVYSDGVTTAPSNTEVVRVTGRER